jgi:DNA topoisomerase-6 subunit A
MSRTDTVTKIKELAQEVHDRIIKNKSPSLHMPLRSLSNVSFDEKVGYFEALGKTKARTLSASTIKTFAQTLHMLSFAKELSETDDEATKREAYYVSKNWGDAKFAEQPESDSVLDDIEGMIDVTREMLGFNG